MTSYGQRQAKVLDLRIDELERFLKFCPWPDDAKRLVCQPETVTVVVRHSIVSGHSIESGNGKIR
jgi:hypothetical protein